MTLNWQGLGEYKNRLSFLRAETGQRGVRVQEGQRTPSPGLPMQRPCALTRQGPCQTREGSQRPSPLTRGQRLLVPVTVCPSLPSSLQHMLGPVTEKPRPPVPGGVLVVAPVKALTCALVTAARHKWMEAQAVQIQAGCQPRSP